LLLCPPTACVLLLRTTSRAQKQLVEAPESRRGTCLDRRRLCTRRRQVELCWHTPAGARLPSQVLGALPERPGHRVRLRRARRVAPRSRTASASRSTDL